jgi:23S rRNA (uracil1939-C5)-methyltransferase
VLDPPRAGAAEQVRALAASQVPRLIHAACDPATFTRDARILTEGGYQLLTVRPLDQFLFSAEIELVALFVRGA